MLVYNKRAPRLSFAQKLEASSYATYLFKLTNDDGTNIHLSPNYLKP